MRLGGETFMAAQYERHIIESVTPAISSATAQIERLERCIAGAERHLEQQEARVREAVLAGRRTAVDDFNLKKMELLLALLREGRERIALQGREAV
jgi:hypothetical protein